MKHTIYYLTFVFLFFMLGTTYAQVTFSGNLIYAEDGVLMHHNTNTKTMLQPEKWAANAELIQTNRLLDCFDAVPETVQIAEDYVLFSAVQSPLDAKWAYMERRLYQLEWKLWIHDPATEEYELIYTESSCPVIDMALAPFGWTSEGKLLLEANQLEYTSDFQGVWELDPATKQLSAINFTGNYVGTPVISPDGQQMIYTATADVERDIIHSPYNELWVMDMSSKSDDLLQSGQLYELQGWTTKRAVELVLENAMVRATRGMGRSAFTYKIPFPEGANYYVTRAGSPVPTGGAGTGTAGCFSTGGAHSGKRAHDWSNFSIVGGYFKENFSSSTEGTVNFAGYTDPNGFGALIRIVMPDGNLCYYGHCSSWFVSAGECVTQGQIIGREGDLGSSTAEHLHQEFRGPSGSASSSFYVVMDDCGGCIPYTGYCYISGNTPRNCGDPPVGGGGCDEEVVSLNGNVASGLYEAETINSSGTVGSGGLVTFRAPERISLNNGFKINPGGAFYAENNDCSAGLQYDDSELEQEDENESFRSDESNGYHFAIQPNPFSNHAEISFELEEALPVSIFVTDLMGRTVNAVYHNEIQEPGIHKAVLNRQGLPGGMYFCTIQIGDYRSTRKLIID